MKRGAFLLSTEAGFTRLPQRLPFCAEHHFFITDTDIRDKNALQNIL